MSTCVRVAALDKLKLVRRETAGCFSTPQSKVYHVDLYTRNHTAVQEFSTQKKKETLSHPLYCFLVWILAYVPIKLENLISLTMWTFQSKKHTRCGCFLETSNCISRSIYLLNTSPGQVRLRHNSIPQGIHSTCLWKTCPLRSYNKLHPQMQKPKIAVLGLGQCNIIPLFPMVVQQQPPHWRTPAEIRLW